jgi:hypothetical protein
LNFDYLPSLDNFPDFRLDARAGYQIRVDPDSNLLLRAGVVDRYNSNPGNRKRNDVEYFLMLGWEF